MSWNPLPAGSTYLIQLVLFLLNNNNNNLKKVLEEGLARILRIVVLGVLKQIPFVIASFFDFGRIFACNSKVDVASPFLSLS